MQYLLPRNKQQLESKKLYHDKTRLYKKTNKDKVKELNTNKNKKTFDNSKVFYGGAGGYCPRVRQFNWLIYPTGIGRLGTVKRRNGQKVSQVDPNLCPATDQSPKAIR